MKNLPIYIRPKRLPLDIRKELIGNIDNQMDLFTHLSKMVHVRRGVMLNHRIKNLTRSHDNAIECARENGYEVFLGYFVWKYTDEPWQYRPHSFCVDGKGKVVEPSAVPNWTSVRSYYIGIPIPERELIGNKHLINFNSKSFVDEHSPLALFDLDYKKDPDSAKGIVRRS